MSITDWVQIFLILVAPMMFCIALTIAQLKLAWRFRKGKKWKLIQHLLLATLAFVGALPFLYVSIFGNSFPQIMLMSGALIGFALLLSALLEARRRTLLHP